MGRMAGIGGLSYALRDIKHSSRREKLLGLASKAHTHDEGSGNCSELNEEDVWMEENGDWEGRNGMSYGRRCWEEDQSSDDSDSMAISGGFSSLSLSGHTSDRDVSARISIPQMSPERGSHHGLRQSAPMNVPNWSEILGSEEKSFRGLQNMVFAQDDDDNDERLPPHELIAREYAKNQAPPFSVYEGIGRTLKGRDLDRVRHAVLRQTGYIDYE